MRALLQLKLKKKTREEEKEERRRQQEQAEHERRMLVLDRRVRAGDQLTREESYAWRACARPPPGKEEEEKEEEEEEASQILFFSRCSQLEIWKVFFGPLSWIMFGVDVLSECSLAPQWIHLHASVLESCSYAFASGSHFFGAWLAWGVQVRGHSGR